MHLPEIGHLTDGDIAEIRDARLKQARDAQRLQDPPVIVQVRRRNASGVLVNHGDPVHLITLRYLNRDERERGQNEGRIALGDDALLRAVDDEIDLQRDDQFTWGNDICVVTRVEPAHNGIVRASLRVNPRNGA